MFILQLHRESYSTWKDATFENHFLTWASLFTWPSYRVGLEDLSLTEKDKIRTGWHLLKTQNDKINLQIKVMSNMTKATAARTIMHAQYRLWNLVQIYKVSLFRWRSTLFQYFQKGSCLSLWLRLQSLHSATWISHFYWYTPPICKNKDGPKG